MFAFTVGAVDIVCINRFNASASASRFAAVCAVLFPADARSPNADANCIVFSDTTPAFDNEFISLLRFAPKSGNAVLVACAFAPALANLDTAFTICIVLLATLFELLSADVS